MSVARDTSGDAMAEALVAHATPEAAAADARFRLFDQRREIVGTIEDLLRIASVHAKSTRLPWREREMTQAAQQRGIVMLAQLADIEKRAQAAGPSGEADGH